MDGACRPQLHSRNQIINLKAMNNPKGTYGRGQKSETMSPNPTEEFWNEHLSAATALPGRPHSALQVIAAAKEVSHPDS
jgi:hypothetical protein